MGELADEKAISQIATPHWWSGTSEVRLAKAANHFGCELPRIRRRDSKYARKSLDNYLRQHIPVILCVDNWQHWITVVANSRSRYVVLDSNDNAVLAVTDWTKLQKRWRYSEASGDFFDLLPVRPQFTTFTRANFSIERALFLRRPENRLLALHWDQYLEDLLEICDKPTSRKPALTFNRFIRRHGETIVERLAYWHGDVTKHQVRKIIKNFSFVANTYGLLVTDENQALVDINILIAFWAASSRGIESLYGSK